MCPIVSHDHMEVKNGQTGEQNKLPVTVHIDASPDHISLISVLLLHLPGKGNMFPLPKKKGRKENLFPASFAAVVNI